MNARKTLCRLLPLSLTLGLLVPACDGGSDAAAKTAKADDAAKAEPKEQAAEEAKPEAAKPEPEAAKPEPEAAKPDEAPAEENPAEDEPVESDDAREEGKDDAKAEAKADAKAQPKAKAEPKAKADEPKAAPAPAASGADGKAIYLKKCKNCHGVSGAADTKLAQKHDIASWKEPGWKGKWSMSKIKDIVTNGKSGTKMKSFKSKLTAEEIDAVAAYSRSLGK